MLEERETALREERYSRPETWAPYIRLHKSRTGAVDATKGPRNAVAREEGVLHEEGVVVESVEHQCGQDEGSIGDLWK